MTGTLFEKLTDLIFTAHQEFFRQAEVDLVKLADYLSQEETLFSLENYQSEKLLESLRETSQEYDTELESEELPDFRCQHILKERKTRIESVEFQPADVLDVKRVACLLSKIGHLELVGCSFFANLFDLKATASVAATVCFSDCVFLEDWVSAGRIDSPPGQALFERCIFEKNILLGKEFGLDLASASAIFADCSFCGDLLLSGFSEKAPLFANSDSHHIQAKSLRLEGCDLRRPFILNRASFDSVTMHNCTFRKKLEFKENAIGVLTIDNCSFEKIANFHGSRIDSFRAEQVIFTEFVGFEACQFGAPGNAALETRAVFNFVTLMGLSNFRHACFHGGLDIRNVNLKDAPNFLGCAVSFAGTDRESFRLIKHSFERVGNQVDANRFLVLELRKRKEELMPRPWHDQERLVLTLNDAISGFGQSYVRPIGLMVALATLFGLLQLGHENQWMYGIHPDLDDFLAATANLFNRFAQGMLPFAKLFYKGMEFFSLLFAILFSVLIWQAVVAVKRHTRN